MTKITSHGHPIGNYPTLQFLFSAFYATMKERSCAHFGCSSIHLRFTRLNSFRELEGCGWVFLKWVGVSGTACCEWRNWVENWVDFCQSLCSSACGFWNSSNCLDQSSVSYSNLLFGLPAFSLCFKAVKMRSVICFGLNEVGRVSASCCRFTSFWWNFCIGFLLPPLWNLLVCSEI